VRIGGKATYYPVNGLLRSRKPAHRAQADALEIEAGAKRRLADEYDAAQERGEVRGTSNQHSAASSPEVAGVADIGLTHKDIHEARLIRDAEAAEASVVLSDQLPIPTSGQELPPPHDGRAAGDGDGDDLSEGGKGRPGKKGY
jgi:hypothetical protein